MIPRDRWSPKDPCGRAVPRPWQDRTVERDRERWDERHAGRPLAHAAPPDALSGDDELLSLVPTAGRAADIACGVGAQTLWLARRGLSVVAFDVSPAAIELTERAAAASGLADRITARVHDLDDGLPPELGDLDVLVCQRFRSPALYTAFVDALAPGGIAVVTVLSGVDIEGSRGGYRAAPGELLAAFADASTDVLHHHERGGQASIIVRRR
jgi:SAM-dependent methyltransferase